MEDGDGNDTTPFWVQSTTNVRRSDKLRSLFFSSGLVIFILMVTALFFLVFVVPSTLSFSGQIFKPNSVKKSWDSLNTVLVLVAVVFGFLSRIKNEDRYSYYDEVQASHSKQNQTQKSNPSTSNQWYYYEKNEEHKTNSVPGSSSVQWYGYPDYQSKLEHKDPILERTSNSNPDLLQVSSNRWDYGDYPPRFYDDINVEMGRVSDLGHLHRRHRSLGEVGFLRTQPQIEPIFVDTLSNEATIPSPIPSPPPSPPTQSEPPQQAQPEEAPQEYKEKPKKRTFDKQARRKEKRLNRKLNKALQPPTPIAEPEPEPELVDPPELVDNLEQEYEIRESSERSSTQMNTNEESTNEESTIPITTPPPPPPPPPPPQQKNGKIERKRGGTSATKDFLNSLYHKNKKKKKQRQKSADNVDSLLHQSETPLSFEIPPPPPSQPPPSVFQNLFSSKKHKRKRTITVSASNPPPPLPPLPPLSPPPQNTVTEPNPNSEIESFSDQNQPEITNSNRFDEFEENQITGGESPCNRVPTPPPPPPPAFLKNPAWKFVVQGDYVTINSASTSRSGSPERDDVYSDETPPAVAFQQPSPLFCPSPDVNSKAESFITNFRAKLKLEKVHSMRKRDLGLSSLGPGLGPSQI